MTVLPVVAREMSVLARRKSTYWARAVTGLLALLVMFWLLLVSRTRISFADMGATMFLVLSSICFAFTVFAGMQATADSVSEEKREGTLGLLFLTDLKGFDVIGGKLAATSLNAVLALIGLIPMLSLALLLGGVTLNQFFLVAMVLANTLFLSLSLGVFVSTLSENERKAMMGTFVGLLVIVVAPFAVAYALSSRYGYFEELICVSPLYAFSALHAKPPVAPMVSQYFWPSVLITHLLAWSFLISAAWLLPRCLNVSPSERFSALTAFAQNFVYGQLADRRKHRAELLDRNAFLWLASRERIKPKYTWGVLAFFIGLYVWVAWQFPNMMFDLAVAGGVLFLLHLVFKVWAASEVCSRLIQDRRSGALELLLSTPLSVKQIADGQSKALARIFLKPLVCVVVLELLLMLGGIRWTASSSAQAVKILFYLVALSTLLLDLWALKWVGLWLSLTGKSIERVLIATLLRILALPWLLFAIFASVIGGAALLQRRQPHEYEVLIGWWAISIPVSAWFGFSARSRFLAQFRELAAKRFDTVLDPEAEIPTNQRVRKSKVPIFVRRHPVTTLVFAVLTIAFLSGWLRGLYWERRVEQEFARIRREGFPVTLQETLRYAPSVPASENAFQFLQAAGPITGGPRTVRVRSDGTNISLRNLQEFQRITMGNEPVLRALWKLPEFHRGSLELISWNFWQEQHRQSLLISLVAADLMLTLNRAGETDRARVKTNVLASLAHARHLRNQPQGFAQQTAHEALQRLTSGLGEVFGKDALHQATLIDLQSEVERMGGSNILVQTIAVQRAQMIEMARNPNAVMGIGMGMVPRPIAFSESLRSAVGSKDRQLAEWLQQSQYGMELAALPVHERLTAIIAGDSFAARSKRIRRQVVTGDLQQLFINDATYLAYLNLIKAGIAAERYELEYGESAKDLNVLVPEFLSTIPVDPFSGESLRSIVTDGLLIYSVGVDRTDNTSNAIIRPGQADLRLLVK